MNTGARRPPPRKIIMNLSVNDDVQLKKSENAWKPGLKRESSADDPELLKTQVGAHLYAATLVSAYKLTLVIRPKLLSLCQK